jgi:uncharacterized membrane protein YraQ (UPF0718 family)
VRAALLVLAGMLLIAAGLAVSRGVFLQGLRAAGLGFVRLVPMLVVAFLLTGFTEALLPAGFVERWLSGAAGARGILVAWVAGALTPAGGLVGMPLAAGLMQAGAGVGVLVTYLTSMAVLPVLRLPMEVGFYGVRLALLRVAASLLLPPVAGLLAQAAVAGKLLSAERWKIKDITEERC